jgi:hypothetical protein
MALANNLVRYVDSTPVVADFTGYAPCIVVDRVAGKLYILASGDVVTEIAGGGGGGAPTNASYVVLGLNGTLTNERVLTAGSGITLTDAGAGGTLTISASGSGSSTVASGTVTIDFGASVTAETDVASVSVSDAGVTAGSEIVASLHYVDTADHTADEVLISNVQVMPGAITAGAGFEIRAYCPSLTWGKYAVHWVRNA